MRTDSRQRVRGWREVCRRRHRRRPKTERPALSCCIGVVKQSAAGCRDVAAELRRSDRCIGDGERTALKRKR
jgi:hypothetical protein